jgi:hypothetical protein
MILDTAQFPKETFFWTPTLLHEYELDEATDYRLRHSYHAAEYLTEFELALPATDASAVTTLQQLIQNGRLLVAVPFLSMDSTKLVGAMQEARISQYNSPRKITMDDVRHAHDLALCFGGRWLFPMTIWTLAMTARSVDDPMLLEKFKDDRHGMYGLDL